MILYSGDRPNPDLGRFVLSCMEGNPYDPDSDSYSVGEFSRSIETTKNSAIFRMHSYHLGKKPHDAVEAYVAHHTALGDLVLDPFCGSGSTALAALRLGRKAVAIDASPAATFISRFYLSPCDWEDLARRFEKMRRTVADELKVLYGTICHLCGADATIHYVIYSNIYNCPRCGGRVSLYEASAYNPRLCPRCLAADGSQVLISPRLEIAGYEPVAVNFSCNGDCRPRRMTRSIDGSIGERNAFRNYDLARIKELESNEIPYPYPRQFMMNVKDPVGPWGDEWRPSRNFRRVSDLFTHRNLWALAALFHAAGDDDDLRAVITSGILAVSRKAQHLNGGGGYIPGNWALPPMSKQRNVLESLTKVFSGILKAKKEWAPSPGSHDACISTLSATSMEAIPSSSVDYVFTDPPYGGAVQYAELNFVWEAWLGFSGSWHDHEIIVNRTRNRSEEYWTRMMRMALRECYRVLKPGRWLSLCYHDASSKMWQRLQEIMAETGFQADRSTRAVTIDTGSNTYNQRVADKVIKRDLVINFRKPRTLTPMPAKRVNTGDSKNFLDLATGIIRDYLSANPGATRDRVYDHLVSRVMRSGRMESHNFERILSAVATSEGEGVARWFLKD